jgi:hypothetical protein
VRSASWTALSPGADSEAIADDEPLGRDDALSVRLDTARDRRRGLREAPRERAGALADPLLEVATDPEEEDEHADRLEVDLADVVDRRVDAHEIGEADRQRDGHVHPGAPDLELPPGRFEERTTGIEDDGGRDEKSHPPHQGRRACLDAVEGPDVEPHRVRHDVHRPEPRDAEADQGRAILLALEGGRLARAIRPGREADLREAQHDGAQRGLARIEVDDDPALRKRHATAVDAFQTREMGLDDPDASRAAEPLDEKTRRASRAVSIADQVRRLDLGRLERTILVAHRLERPRRGAGERRPSPVPLRQPLRLEHLRGGSAADAAHRMERPEHPGREPRPFRDVEPAVEAGLRLRRDGGETHRGDPSPA